jgi:alanine racemase
MVMNPEEASFDAMRRYHLEPELYSLNILKNYVAYCIDYDEVFNIHLKIDTGMHRLGFEMPDIQELIQIFNFNNNIKIASIFTHLVASDAAEHDGLTHEQIKRFREIYTVLTEGVGYTPMRHVLNSGGISRFKEYQFEMVRLGIGLYGIDGNKLIQKQLHIVQTLKATISQIKNIAAHETVGYSRRGILNRKSRIATISIGYADGLLRGASVGNFAVWLHGKRAPIVGNVCMDMTMIDVTDIPQAQEGDEVEIFGQNLPVQELATALGTIPYEVFTNVSERVKRVYFQE